MAFRDVHTARHHGWVSETRYGTYGQIALGPRAGLSGRALRPGN
jgi:hypothetical protein